MAETTPTTPTTSTSKMSRPSGPLFWVSAFLLVIAVLAFLLLEALRDAFMANAAFNGLIIGVLVVGILVNYRQILNLYREAAWIEEFRRKDPERPMASGPRLLAPMARMLAQRERGQFSLSAMSLRSLLDSIRSRLDESRDVSRYLIGLLVFLGLLGTFWGLLATIGDVSQVISGMSLEGQNAVAVFGNLKEGLQGPLNGMAIAFSSSLFGLAGSLVLGFVDLQSGHAQNRFFNELEEWLAGVTRLSTGALPGDGEASVPAYVQALLEQTADSLERLQRSMAQQSDARGDLEKQLLRLNHSLTDLTTQLQGGGGLSEDLRAELRLLNRTIAAAMGNKAKA
ncbi:MAG: flagellar motor protein MotA [Xanthomonadales bacterium]|nr:flagellar motor protein MotA [Xanthomonadales bacterium]